MTTEYSIQKMVSDGTLSTIALGIQYLQRNDIYVRIAGVETPQSGAPSGYTWSFINNNTLKILPVVPNGVEVVVYRKTDVDAMYNIYSQNAQFDEATIDENNQQLLFIAQEYLEQGIPGAGVSSLEYINTVAGISYYRFRLTDGAVTPPFGVPDGTVAFRNELAASNGAQLVGSAVRTFDSVQTMLAATDLELGQKVTTGATTWRITSAAHGWPLSNGTQYALPLNGVWVEDAGADPLGVNDSYAAFEFVRAKFNVDTKRRFTMCLGGGDYKLSQELALTQTNSYFRINGGGASITATANMDAIISWPMITTVRISGIRFAHNPGVIIASGVLYGGKAVSTSKTTRHIIKDVEAYNISGAPVFILMKQVWESKFINIRSDHDVSGMSGTNIKLLSCVNNEFSGIEVGYSSIGIHFSKSDDVTYKCEGINFTGITTFAKTAVKGDFITALRIKGVFDFCETVAMEFTNGADVEVNAWLANTSTSTANGSLIVSLPSFSGLKIAGSHFVNNAAVTFNAASINSPNSKIVGNTGQNCQPGFRYSGSAGPVDDWGNNFGVSQTQSNVISGISTTLWGDANSAPLLRIRSGKPGPVAGQLLSRIELSAPNVNAANSVQIDAVQGNFGDVVSLKIGYNGTPKFNIDVTGGDFECLTPGRGIRLTSPNSAITRTLRLSNTGTVELI